MLSLNHKATIRPTPELQGKWPKTAPLCIPETLVQFPYTSCSYWHYLYIQVVSRLVDITAGGDFRGFCDQKSSYKHVSDFGRLRSYDRLKLRIDGNDY